MRPALLLILPILLLSGCVIPGIGTLPFFGPVTTAYEHDVIVIKELTALPETVAPGQPIKLVAYIQNVGNVPVSGITIELYDYCPGQFSLKEDTKAEHKNIQLLPGQTKSIDWELTATQLSLPASCGLKVRAGYSYTTQALSTIAFIHYTEYQRLLSEGKFSPRQPYIAQGYGPLKPLLSTLEQQPIPVPEQGGSTFTATFEIENKGGGFVTGNQIKANNITFSSPSGEGQAIVEALDKCKSKWETIELVQQRSAKLICEGIPTPRVATETTITVTTAINYNYEFRNQATVTIRPVA